MISRLVSKIKHMVFKGPTHAVHNPMTMHGLLTRLNERELDIKSVIDIGASNGAWSRICMETMPGKRHLAIDPLVEWEEGLQSLKSGRDNFYYKIALAGEEDNESGMGIAVSADLVGSTVEDGGAANVRQCPIRSLDSLVEEFGLPAPYLIKFDTHGYEVPILNGAEKILRDTNAIIMECYNFEISPTALLFYDMCKYMESLGFRPLDLCDPFNRIYDNAFWQLDILFCRSENKSFNYKAYR